MNTNMNRHFLNKLVCAAISMLLVLAPIAGAQQPDDSSKEKAPKWDVLNPPFPLTTLNIDTDETTWSSLDVTPDGEKFVFDMLGDIYVVDIAGGDATSLTQDFAWNIQPAVSPDGK